MAETISSVPEDAEERASRILLESVVQLRAFASSSRRTVPIPAAPSSIGALDKVLFPEDGECSICMEKLNTGSLLNRMPCSHLFHEFCIVRWLNVNHTCPCCRFSLPTRSSS